MKKQSLWSSVKKNRKWILGIILTSFLSFNIGDWADFYFNSKFYELQLGKPSCNCQRGEVSDSLECYFYGYRGKETLIHVRLDSVFDYNFNPIHFTPKIDLFSVTKNESFDKNRHLEAEEQIKIIIPLPDDSKEGKYTYKIEVYYDFDPELSIGEIITESTQEECKGEMVFHKSIE